MRPICIFATAVLMCFSNHHSQLTAQTTFELAVRPGFLYDMVSAGGSPGLVVNFLISRTPSMSVGGEVGHFGVWKSRVSMHSNDPRHGFVVRSTDQTRRFWYATASARFGNSAGRSAYFYQSVATGLYFVRETTVFTERDVTGREVWLGGSFSRSLSIHPGVSLGLGAGSLLLPFRIRGDAEFRAHALLGLDKWVHTQIVLSLGFCRSFSID